MKRTLIFVPLIALISCSQKRKSEGAISPEAAANMVKSDDSLQSIINANIQKQPAIDTIFLGFAFGMTETETLVHFNWLVKHKKLVMNDADNRYEYPMTFNLVKANASIAPEYHDNKLYKLSLIIIPAEDIGTQKTVYLQAAVTYMEKYKSFNLFQEADLIDPSLKQFHWIKNNLHIYLHDDVSSTEVNYINMPVDELVKKKKSISADSSKAQTNKDI